LGIVGVVSLAAAFGAGMATGRATAPKATSSTAALSDASGASSSAKAATTQGLVSALIPIPSGGKKRTATGASADGSLDLDQFVTMLYPSASGESSILQTRGFTGAATRWMTTAAGQDVSVYLIGFSAADGAQSYALGLASAHEADTSNAGQTKFTLPLVTDGTGYENAKLDTYGNTSTDLYGAVGNVTIIVHFYNPGTLDRSAAIAMINDQATRLTSYES
jgi:hypothetical protein